MVGHAPLLRGAAKNLPIVIQIPQELDPHACPGGGSIRTLNLPCRPIIVRAMPLLCSGPAAASVATGFFIERRKFKSDYSLGVSR